MVTLGKRDGWSISSLEVHASNGSEFHDKFMMDFYRES